jgi:hypothetical protein
MLSRNQKKTFIIAGLIVVGAAYGCGKKKSSSSGSSDVLAKVYPDGLSVSVYPQTNSTSLALAEDKEQSAKAKNEDAGKRLKGEGECFPPALRKEGPSMLEEKCYEFDYDMIYNTRVNSSGGADTYITGTKTGLSNATGSTEACMVAFTRGKVKQLSGMVDRTLGMVQMMICQAKKTGVSAPTSDGESIDFKAVMEAAATAAGKDPTHMPVSAAKMTHSGDLYVTEIEMKIPAKPGTPAGASDPKEKIILTHKPTDAADTYSGTIVIRRDKDFDNTASKERILTIAYERSGDSVKYKMLTASVNTAISANAVVNGALDLNVSTNASGDYLDASGVVYPAQNDAVSGIMMVAYNMNPSTSAGNFAYWVNPGAGYVEKPRGFVSNVTADATTGLLSGCSSSGAFSYGSIRKSIKDGKTIVADGSHHPFSCQNSGGSCLPAGATSAQYYTGNRDGVAEKNYIPAFADTGAAIVGNWMKEQSTPNANATVEGIVARQCFSQGADGVYTLDTAKMSGSGTAGYHLVPVGDASLPTPPDLGTIK